MSRKVLLIKTGRVREVAEVAGPEEEAVLSLMSILYGRGLGEIRVGRTTYRQFLPRQPRTCLVVMGEGK
jgi:hypothetical protein